MNWLLSCFCLLCWNLLSGAICLGFLFVALEEDLTRLRIHLYTSRFDCGMFMIKYADFYSRGFGLCFNQVRHVMLGMDRLYIYECMLLLCASWIVFLCYTTYLLMIFNFAYICLLVSAQTLMEETSRMVIILLIMYLINNSWDQIMPPNA